MWLISLLVHLFSNTGFNAILRQAASGKKIDSMLLSAIMSAAIAVPALIGIMIAGIDFSRFSPTTTIAFVIVVITGVTFHILNANALKYTEASVFTFLYNLRICVATVLGILFLAEPVNAIRLTGGGLVFLAGFLIIGRVIGGVKGMRKGIVLSVLAAVNIAVLNMFEKALIISVGFTNIVFPAAIIETLILWAIVFLQKIPLERKTLLSPSILVLMPFRCASAYGFLLALYLGALLSVSTYISSLSFITTSLVGIIFLKERDLLPNKIISAVIAFGGVTLILISSI